MTYKVCGERTVVDSVWSVRGEGVTEGVRRVCICV